MSANTKKASELPQVDELASLVGLTAEGNAARLSPNNFFPYKDFFSETVDLNNLVDTGLYGIHATACQNYPGTEPSRSTGFLLLVFAHSPSKPSPSYLVQWAFYGMWISGIYIRRMTNGVWGGWNQIT